MHLIQHLEEVVVDEEGVDEEEEGVDDEDEFVDGEGDRWAKVDEYGDRSFMWEYK